MNSWAAASNYPTRLGKWVTLLACFAVLIACTNNPTQPVRRHVVQLTPQAPYHGIDISSHQGQIDWNRVSTDKDIHFVYIKATEGATYRSPHYGYNVAMARRNGLLVGSYHYFRPEVSVDKQFSNFLGLAAPSSQDLIPMIDVEKIEPVSRKQLIDSVMRLSRLMEQYYGARPMIYSTMAFYNSYLAPHFNKFHLYIGRYNEEKPNITWSGSYTVWQFSQSGIVPGIDAYVDLCRMSDGKQLKDILLPQ